MLKTKIYFLKFIEEGNGNFFYAYDEIDDSC